MLAYVFWHRPRAGVERDEYEEAQRLFHRLIEVPSACFRLTQLPFEAAPGYEDWYLVEDWQGLGDLNAAAVDPRRLNDHDRAARLAGEGWGAVYALLRGPARAPDSASWLDKPRGESISAVLGGLDERVAVWRRQMVLGPAPELCVAAGPPRATVVSQAPGG